MTIEPINEASIQEDRRILASFLKYATPVEIQALSSFLNHATPVQIHDFVKRIPKDVLEAL